MDVLVDMLRLHVGIGDDPRPGESLLLAVSGFHDFLTNAGRVFTLRMIEDLVDVFSRDLEYHIDTIQEGSGDFALVAFDLIEATGTGMLGVVIVAAGTGIHRGDKHKIRRILDGPRDTRDIDDLVFDGLSEDFEGLSRELGEFIEEEDAFVCQTHFSGCQCPASADDRDPAGGMMDLTKWPTDDERLLFG